MESLVLGTPFLYFSFAIVFVVGVALGYLVISLIGSS